VLYPSYILGGIASDQYTHRDYIEHADRHAGSQFVLSEDIKNFFPSTGETIVSDVWRGLFGFGPEVSASLPLASRVKPLCETRNLILAHM